MGRPPSRLEKEHIERAERVAIEQEVFLSSFGSSSKIKVYCKNASSSGFLIVDRDLPFSLNTLVELYIYSLDQKKQIKLIGKIVRINSHAEDESKLEYGVRFSFQDQNELSVWAQFINTLKV